MARPVGGGLSGEHIQLCAEGARRISPNLSGKWTETQDALFFAEQSLCRAAFLFFEEKLERGNCYAQQTYGFYRICQSV
jgi:hypothetical protein